MASELKRKAMEILDRGENNVRVKAKRVMRQQAKES